MTMIAVRPAHELRRPMARWAVTEDLRTVSADAFGVPADRFVDLPEHLLVGAMIDGQPYVEVDHG